MDKLNGGKFSNNIYHRQGIKKYNAFVLLIPDHDISINSRIFYRILYFLS